MVNDSRFGECLNTISSVVIGYTPDLYFELTCTACGQVLRDVDDGDYLEVLVSTAIDHRCPSPL